MVAQESEAFRTGFSEWFSFILFGVLNFRNSDEKQENNERNEKAAKIANQDDLQSANR